MKPSDATSSRSALIPIFFIVFVDILGLTIMIPFLPFYAQKFGATPTVVGAVISSYAIFQLVSGPILGSLSDRYGRRPVLLLSQLGTFIGFAILAWANALWMVFLSRVVDGATAGNITVAQATIADVTKPHERVRAFSIIGISFGLGFLLGPAISGVLLEFNPNAPIYAAMLLSATSVVLTYFMLPEPPTHVVQAPGERRAGVFDWSQYRMFFQDPKIRSYLIQFLLFAFSFSIFFSGFPLFAERRLFWRGEPFGAREVGYLYAFSGCLGVFIQGGLVARLSNRFGETKMVACGFLACVVGYAILAETHSIPTLLVSATVSAFGTGFLRPTLTSLISRNSPPQHQGKVFGLTASITSVSQIVAPLLAGAMIDFGWLALWGLSASAIALGGLALILRARSEGARVEIDA